MRLNRSLCILELEQRIAPAFTMTLDGVASFVFTDIDGDTVTVTRDAGGAGLIDVTDDDATGLGDFDEINSIVFNAGCDLTTTLSVIVTNSGVSSDGIATVDYIDFTAPAAIGSIEIEGDILGTLAMDTVASAVGDLDGDGNLDIVVANYENDSISVFMGGGDNTFTAANYNVGSGPLYVAIADLDGVNNPDIVVANSDGNTVSVLLNNGSGTFGADTEFGTGTSPESVAIADLDGDGNLDLAVANTVSDNVSILLGTGAGTFGAKTDYSAGNNPLSIAIADFDGVNNPDLVVANSLNDTVSILINNGSGVFAAPVAYDTGDEPVSVYTDDLDGDGSPDLAVANKSSDNVSVLLGNGDGTFAASIEYEAGSGPDSISIGDLDGDGSPDLAVANYDSEDITILFNDGGGAFAPFTGDGPVSVVSADLNADGISDLVVTNSNDNTVSVLIGRGNGTFAERVDYTTDTGPVSVAIKDLDNNDSPDLAVACYDGNSVSIFLNNGDGTFGAKTDYDISFPAVPDDIDVFPLFVAIEDLDGNGTPDLAVSGDSSGSGYKNLSILRNNGDGTFVVREDDSYGWLDDSSVCVAIGDLNNDEKPDLVVLNWFNSKVSIILSEGGGNFSAPVNYNTGANPIYVSVGDMDGDEDLDLVVANWGDRTISILFNNNDGSFTEATEDDVYGLDIDSRPSSVSIANLDGDNDLDLVVTDEYTDQVFIFFNYGSGDFPVAPTSYDTGSGPAAASLADLNGDGYIDMAVADENDDCLYIRYNNGRGIFSKAETYDTGSEPVFLVMGDFDGINGLDLAVVNRGNHCFSTLLNDGEGVFGGKTNFGQGSGDSITGSTINSLVVRSAQSADGGIENPAVGGNVIASTSENAVVLTAGLAGDINIEGAVTGVASGEIGIHITGGITGSITVGDMTDKAISQFDAGGDEGIDGATITITGDDLDGNLGGIRTDGGITDTTIDIAGDLDPSALGINDAISTDWNDNGVGTITNTTIAIGGDFVGDISNNQNLAGGYWPAVPNFQDMSLNVSVWGCFDGNIISGGSIIDSAFWVDPYNAYQNNGRMESYILAFEDLKNLVIEAYAVGKPYPEHTSIIAADAEEQIEFLYGFSFPAPTLDDGEISNMQVTATSGITVIIGNDLEQGDGVGEDVEVTLNAGTGMVMTVISANDLTLNAVGLTSYLIAEEISAGNNAEVNLGFSEIFDTTVEAVGDLTMNVVVAGGTNNYSNYPYFRPGVISNVRFEANTGLIGGNFIGNISCEGNLHDFHISGYDVTLLLELTPNSAAGQSAAGVEQTGERGDFLSGDITALNDIKSDTGVGLSMNNFGATVTAGRDIIFEPGQVFRASASILTFWDSGTNNGKDKDAGDWVTSTGTVMAAGDIDVDFEFEATSAAGTVVLPPWYDDFKDDPTSPNPEDPDPLIPDNFSPIPYPPEDLHVLTIKADSDFDGNGTFSGSLTTHLGLAAGSRIYGESISADITIERLEGTNSDVDVYGRIEAGDGGISGDIFLGGDLNEMEGGTEHHPKLSCSGDFTGDFTLGGNLNTRIFIGGNSTGTLYIMGNIANVVPPNPGGEFYEVRIIGNCNEFHVGGDIGPGTSPDDTVFIRADSFQLLQIDGDVNDYVDILAGDEPGTGDIVTLVTGGFVVPEHLTSAGTMIRQIRGNIIHGSVPWPIEVGNRTVKLQLSDAIGGGTLKIRVRRGSATFFFTESADGKVDELAGITVNEGTPSIYMKASEKDSDAVLGFMRAPAYQLTGVDTVLFRSVKDLEFKNIDIEEIDISGNARNIRIKNGDLGDCTIGDPDHPGETGIGDLNSLLLQGSSSRGTGDLTGALFVLNDLTNKLDAVNATGSIVIGGDARSISVRRDLEAPINVAGNLRNLAANRDVNGINQPINIGGDLVNFKAKRGPFTSTVEILGRLRGKFDMRGGANSATRTITFDPFAYTTTADYTSGGVLVVHDRVKHSRIR